MFVHTLTRDDVYLGYAYAQRVRGSMIKYSFRTGTNKREDEILFNNVVCGVFGELAFSEFLLTQFGLDVPARVTIHDLGTGDNGDFLINGVNIDVKTTGKRSNYLLVDFGDIEQKRRRGCLSDFYVLALSEWSGGDVRRALGARVAIMGFVHKNDLNGRSTIASVIKRGQTLPNTKIKMIADNYAIHREELRTNWGGFLNFVNDKKRKGS